jgi:4-hydroxybenzoate polyprenyltransferase
LNTTSLQNQLRISRLKLFLALSRTSHGLLDLAAPSMSALLWLNGFPSLEVMTLGLLTAFSGYTAVYALNDVVDHRLDREKMQGTELSNDHQDLDSLFVRHPMAQGMLSHGEGIFWMAAWAALAAVGAYLLNPICAFIFLLACLLEYSYCRLLKVTSLRGIISGLVKTSGPLAAVFAVDPNPNPAFLAALFFWLFFWEIGGQNVPNDWGDLEEDRRLQAQTIPVRFGLRGAIGLILFSLGAAVALSLLMCWFLPKRLIPAYLLGALFSGVYFLFVPACRLLKSMDSQDAFALFNRASYYPLAMLLVTMLSWLF